MRNRRRLWSGLRIFFELKLGLTASGPEVEGMASLRPSPFWDLDFGVYNGVYNASQMDFDWEFFYNYLGIKMKDSILEVRSCMTLLRIALLMLSVKSM